MAATYATALMRNLPVEETPSAATSMNALKYFFQDKSHMDLMLECVGGGEIADTPGISLSLIPNLTVVGIDTEAWTRNTSMMTEIGLAIFDRSDMADVQRSQDYGDFGERFLQKVKFHHFRLVEHAHMGSRDTYPKYEASQNRFGQTRYVTFNEAKEILQQVFIRPIDPMNPQLGVRPVVFLGHALTHDEDNLRRAVGFDITTLPNVVGFIDTQRLAKDTGYYKHHCNEIGLRPLTSLLGFNHTDPHTACNDIARTIICAIQMVLPVELRHNTHRTMQDVATAIELYSQQTFHSVWGSERCCIRCGDRDHFVGGCQSPVECWYYLEEKPKAARSHIRLFCLTEAEAIADERREADRLRKAAEAALDRQNGNRDYYRARGGRGRGRGRRGRGRGGRR